MAEMKRYIMAARRSAQPPQDWQQRVADIEGVTITGRLPGQVHLTATEQAIDRLRQEFLPSFHIEEAAERKPLA